MSGGMISVTSRGSSFKKTQTYLEKLKSGEAFKILEKYGAEGVAALAAVTPVKSGLTAASWDYEVIITRGSARLIFRNTNVHNGSNIAILIQYGHGTGTGGYVGPRDYINPVIKPLFKRLRDEVWKEVTSA